MISNPDPDPNPNPNLSNQAFVIAHTFAAREGNQIRVDGLNQEGLTLTLTLTLTPTLTLTLTLTLSPDP